MQIPFSKVTMLCGRQGPKYGRSTDEQRGRGQEVGYEKWKYVKVGMIILEKQEKKMKEHIINWFSIKRKKTERKKKWVKAAKLCKEQFCFVAFIGICLSGWGQLVIVLFVFRTSPISWRTVRTAWTKVSGRLSRVVGLLSSLSSPGTISQLEAVLASGLPWTFHLIDKKQFTANCRFGKYLMHASLTKSMEIESDWASFC